MTIGYIEVIIYQWSETEIVVESLPMSPGNHKLKVFIGSNTCGFSSELVYLNFLLGNLSLNKPTLFIIFTV